MPIKRVEQKFCTQCQDNGVERQLIDFFSTASADLSAKKRIDEFMARQNRSGCGVYKKQICLPLERADLEYLGENGEDRPAPKKK